MQENKVLNISLNQLVGLYNNIPQVLSAYAIAVKESDESFRRKLETQIILEPQPRGQFWIINLDTTNKNSQYYLVPRADIALSYKKIRAFRCLFHLDHESPSAQDTFILETPALVLLLPDGQTWRLEQPGSIACSIAKEDALTALSREVKTMSNRILQLESESKHMVSIFKNNQDWLNQTREIIPALWSKIENIPNTQSSKMEAPSKTAVPLQPEPPKIKHPKSREAPTQKALVTIYNDSSKPLPPFTKVSVILRRLHHPPTIQFQKNDTGNYWMIQGRNSDYLVPSRDLQINRNTTADLGEHFEFMNYSLKCNHFKLIEPATLSAQDDDEFWVLNSKGILEFY